VIEDTIVAMLDSAGITNYPLVPPHDAPTPCVVYQKISMMDMRSHEGYVAERGRWQFSCYAYTYPESKDLAETVKALFDLNQIDFELATREGEIDTPDPDTGLFRKILDFFIWK